MGLRSDFPTAGNPPSMTRAFMAVPTAKDKGRKRRPLLEISRKFLKIVGFRSTEGPKRLPQAVLADSRN